MTDKKPTRKDSEAGPAADPSPVDGSKPVRSNRRTALAVATGAVLGLALAAGLVFAVASTLNAQHTAGQVEDIATGQVQLEEKVAEHQHTWVPNYAAIHHDAEYEDVWHAPVYESATTYHTVCNECQSVIDGVAAEHIADTGHSGYSTNVPVENEVLKQAGYTEPVLVSEAWDETVIEGVTCTGCGDVLSADAAKDAGVSIPEAS